MTPRAPDLFPSIKDKLLPHFETYRLRPLDPETDVHAFELPGEGATQGRVQATTQQLSFREMRARIGWNHLETAHGLGVYIDTEWNVIGFQLENLQPKFTTLASLPRPITPTSEFPRVLNLSSTLWAISTGGGSVYLLRLDGSASLIARYDLDTPFQLYAGHGSEGDWRLLVTRTVVDESKGTSRYAPRDVSFDLMELKMGGENGGDDAPGKLEVLWTLRGRDVPYFSAWDDGWLVLSEQVFEVPSNEEESEEEKKEREMKERVAKLGLGAHLEQEQGIVDKGEEAMDVDRKVDHPFTWTQDATTVALTFPMESAEVTKKDLEVSIKPNAIGVVINSTLLPAPLVTFLQRPERSLWSDIKVDDSTWTLDGNELEITLVKVDENTRWPSVFAPADDSDDEEEEVPETFDANTLASIRESFASVKRPEPTESEPQGPHPGIPALIREEMDFDLEDEADDDVDAAGAVGRQVLIGHIVDGNAEWSRQAPSVLSLPLTSDISVIVKQAVDGLLFAPPTPPADPTRTPWLHEGTSPALAFVMSSKRDLRLVRHVTIKGKTTVLAFDSGSGTGNGNAYVYYPADLAGSGTLAPQGVVGVSGRERGALLGVGYVNGAVVALCERALVVLGPGVV